jgi:hypothetical protein
MLENSIVAAGLTASQEGLSSTELVSWQEGLICLFQVDLSFGIWNLTKRGCTRPSVYAAGGVNNNLAWFPLRTGENCFDYAMRRAVAGKTFSCKSRGTRCIVLALPFPVSCVLHFLPVLHKPESVQCFPVSSNVCCSGPNTLFSP